MVYKSMGDFQDLKKYERKHGDTGDELLKYLTKENGDLGSEERDCAEALTWFRKSADQNRPNADLSIGMLYDAKEGCRVGSDEAEATKWFKKAREIWEPLADKGDAEAQFNMGSLYYNGRAVKKDHEKAMEWWRKAAAQGNADAMYQIGVAYYDGNPVKQDGAEAIKWLRKAAERGDSIAQMNLSQFYEAGEIVPRDYTEAYFWDLLYQQQIHVAARSELEKKLTPQQIATVKKRAAEWKPTPAPPLK